MVRRRTIPPHDAASPRNRPLPNSNGTCRTGFLVVIENGGERASNHSPGDERVVVGVQNNEFAAQFGGPLHCSFSKTKIAFIAANFDTTDNGQQPRLPESQSNVDRNDF